MKTTNSNIATKATTHFAWGSRAWSSAAIAGGFAIAGLIYGLTEINSTSHLEGAVVSEHWVNHWLVVWVSAAVAAVALLAPIAANFWTAYKAHRLDAANDAALSEMMRVDPKLRSEFYAMQSRQEELTLSEQYEATLNEINVQDELSEEREPAFSLETKAMASALSTRESNNLASALEPLGAIALEPASVFSAMQALRNSKRRAVIGYL